MSLTPDDATTLDALQKASVLYEEYVQLAAAASQQALIEAQIEETPYGDAWRCEASPLGLIID